MSKKSRVAREKPSLGPSPSTNAPVAGCMAWANGRRSRRCARRNFFLDSMAHTTFNVFSFLLFSDSETPSESCVPVTAYQDRVCPHCLDKGITVLGDEIHIICHCPATQGVLQQFTAKFQGLTRLLDLPPFASFTPDEKTRMVLGNPPPQVLQKGLHRWIMEATPI